MDLSRDAPASSLVRLCDLYSDDLLARLIGVSTQTVRCYRAGSSIPTVVAERIGYVADVTDVLIGTYTTAGLRRWWDRPRAELDGQSPMAALGEAWDPRGTAAKTVAMLAGELLG